MAGPIYAADGPGAIRAVPLDGLVALFHRPSGMTHIVAPPAPQILEALQEGPADARTLLARIAAVYEIGEGSAEAIEARLAELEEAGLVRRA
ncbi:MAG TPA: HPr-rel-A system PqqD family peptide chaperone [Allosphingosinicella sp.]|nr:HPr-rel-A system PqqD family peptide chaperone [Allosphingosinicella sp.]